MDLAREIARETEREDDACLVRSTARQGDLIVSRSADTESHSDDPYAAMLAAGRHGEHWLIAEAGGSAGSDLIDLPRGGLIVHTDKPAGRHGALRLTPGVWKFNIQRELDTNNVINEVKD